MQNNFKLYRIITSQNNCFLTSQKCLFFDYSQSVLASIWTLCKAQDNINMNMYIKKSPFDPSSFSEEVTGCHGDCADMYYKCFFKFCDTNTPDTEENIAADVQNTNDNLEHKPSFWSNFLYSFTFGYFGSPFTGSRRLLKSLMHSDQTEDLQMFAGDTVVCVNKCRSAFHKCYNKCICHYHPDYSLCQPKINVSKNRGDIYHFDWDKFS